jgi:hypothetical protein
MGLPRPLQLSGRVTFKSTLITLQVDGRVLHSVYRQFFAITGLDYHEVLGWGNIVKF